MGSAVRISDVALRELPGRLHGIHLDAPEPGGDSETYDFHLAGWVLSKSAPVTSIHILQEGRSVAQVAVDQDPESMPGELRQRPGASSAGFAASVNALSLRSKFELALHAQLENGG